MSEVKGTYTKQEITSQMVQNVLSQQMHIRSSVNNGRTGVLPDVEENKKGMKQQDSLCISTEAQMLYEEMERIREENEDSAKTAEQQSKCMLIAMRIAAGDKVPQKDIKFLIKYNMGLYAKAMQMRIPKTEPEEYDTVLDEEDEKELEKGEMGVSMCDDTDGNCLNINSNITITP